MVAGGVATVLRRSVAVTTIAPIAVTATHMGTDPPRSLTQGLPFRPDHALGIRAPHGPLTANRVTSAARLSPSPHVCAFGRGHGRRFHNRATFIFPDSQLRCLLHDRVFHMPADQTDHAAGSSEHIERCLDGSRSAIPIRGHQPALP
jgi:hypothetical protein